jgi:hypothetical protein
MHYYLSLDILPRLEPKFMISKSGVRKDKMEQSIQTVCIKQSSRSFMELPINFEYFVSALRFLIAVKLSSLVFYKNT